TGVRARCTPRLGPNRQSPAESELPGPAPSPPCRSFAGPRRPLLCARDAAPCAMRDRPPAHRAAVSNEAASYRDAIIERRYSWLRRWNNRIQPCLKLTATVAEQL